MSALRLSLLVLIPLAGCGHGPARTLEGTWVGKPDTVAARGERDENKYRELVAASGGLTIDGDDDASARPPALVTDWERHDVEVTLDLQANQRVRLAINGAVDGAPVEGTWKIVESGPAGVVIEIVTPAAPEGAGDPEPVRRRFELGLDQRSDGLDGFTLHEVGADRRLGALYFRRAER
ncbi:MAG: hypothetical protein KF688_08290 [Pirellulales bacterium]|nr:hypothetical protein [Pirellulales bacterium]